MTNAIARTILIAVFAAAVLAGCQALDNLASDGETEPAAPKTATVAPAPATAELSDSGTASAPVDDDPMQFLGLYGTVVAAQLGTPDLIRRDGGAEVRQFRGSSCILDLFLYPDGGSLAVKHVELRGPSLDNTARRACLAEMIRSRTVAG